MVGAFNMAVIWGLPLSLLLGVYSVMLLIRTSSLQWYPAARRTSRSRTGYMLLAPVLQPYVEWEGIPVRVLMKMMMISISHQYDAISHRYAIWHIPVQYISITQQQFTQFTSTGTCVDL